MVKKLITGGFFIMQQIYTNGLYHKQLKWYNSFDFEIKQILKLNNPYKLSYHAITQCNDEWRRQYDISTIDNIDVLNGDVFEVEITSGKISKFCIRCKYNNKYDITLVIIPKNDCLFIKTLWLNKFKDNHKTLLYNKYVIA
jgi:hypothetical protein